MARVRCCVASARVPLSSAKELQVKEKFEETAGAKGCGSMATVWTVLMAISLHPPCPREAGSRASRTFSACSRRLLREPDVVAVRRPHEEEHREREPRVHARRQEGSPRELGRLRRHGRPLLRALFGPGDDPLLRTGKVSFGGVVKDVSFAYVPDVQPGQYVIVHVGFALQIVDEEEAKQVFAYLREMGELQELEEATQ